MHKRVGRVWPYILSVLLLPLIVVWHQDNTLFPPPGQVDTWVYLGFFRNLANFKQTLFPGTYYGSRLSWILPGYVVHSLFSPIVANYVLHLMVHLLATVSFFTILRLTVGVRTAFLATMVLSVNPLLWNATGWDYVDGAGVAYCLLTMALLTRAALQPVRKWSLLLGGMALAGSVYTNVVWSGFTPFLFTYYIALAWIWHRAPPVRSFRYLCLWLGAGFAIVTAVFGGINYRIDGNFWFYAPSLRTLSAVELDKNPWYVSAWAPEGLWPWLWFTALAALTAIVLLALQIRRKAPERDAVSMLLSVELLLAMALMGCVQSIGTPVLGLRYYASYLLPFAFPVIGVSFFAAVEKMSQRTYVLICCGAGVVFGAVWYDYSGHLTPIWPHAVRETAWVGAGFFAMALMFRQRIAGTLLALAGCAIFMSEVRFTLKAPLTTDVRNKPPVSPHEYRRNYERTMRSREIIESVRNGNPIRFWYDGHEPAFLDYTALNSTYLYAFTWLGAKPEKRACDSAAEPGDLVVVSSGNDAVQERARRMLGDCWVKLGMTALPVAKLFSSGDASYSTIVLRATPSLRRPLQAVFDSAGSGNMQLAEKLTPATLPLDRWKESHGEHGWGAIYAPLIAPMAGRYRFALKYKAGSGHFRFGGYAGDSSRWLAVTTVGRALAERDFEIAIWVELQRGEAILLRIENDDETGDRPASFLMEQLTAIEIDK